MLREIDSNGRINVRIHPIAKARMIAECERRCRTGKGLRITLSMLLNDFGWSLMALPEAIERELQNRQSSGKSPRAERSSSAQKGKRLARLTATT